MVYKILIVTAIISIFYGAIYSLANSGDSQWVLTAGAVALLIIASSLLKIQNEIEHLKIKNKQLENKLNHTDTRTE